MDWTDIEAGSELAELIDRIEAGELVRVRRPGKPTLVLKAEPDSSADAAPAEATDDTVAFRAEVREILQAAPTFASDEVVDPVWPKTPQPRRADFIARLEAISRAAAAKATPGPCAARSQDFLFDEFGLPK
jgi:antitoxin (DNA-binding transcriptional repressor) of toxin-antitoxin stability system